MNDITERKKNETELKEKEYLLKQQNEEYEAINEELREANDLLITAKEKAEENDKLKSAFLANMSHELRTPMNAIIGFSDFLTKPDITDLKRERFTKLIQKRSYDLLQIIEDILDISKIEVGQLKFCESEFSLSELLCEIYDFYIHKIKTDESKNSIELKLTLPDEFKQTIIRTDNQRLKQILNNLLDNAIKFTNAGTINFGVNLQIDATVTFYVSDTGIGIPANKQEIIFDRFRQAEDALTAKQYGGTGLGLSIVKGIVNQFHGRIWLESIVDKGTTFFFTIPFIQKESIPEAIVEPKSNLKPFWKNKTVLIVEDDEANTEYLKEVLSDTGLRLLNVYNGKQTLQTIEDNSNIDLILMDIQLPDTNGLNLTKIIRKSNPKIKIIAQTAYATSFDMQECIEAGCHDYISKPIKQSNLFSVIGRYFNKV